MDYTSTSISQHTDTEGLIRPVAEPFSFLTCHINLHLHQVNEASSTKVLLNLFSDQPTNYFSMLTSLKRGAACASCRRRKIRCSGTRPTCDQCARLGPPTECEYIDNSRASRCAELEQEVMKLRTRLEEYEPPMPVSLHPASSSSAAIGVADSSSWSYNAPNVPVSYTSSLPAAYDNYAPTAGPSSYQEAESLSTWSWDSGTTVESAQSHHSFPTPCWWKPTRESTWAFINSLTPHAAEFGFFLNLYDEFGADEHGTATAGKMLFRNVVILWSIHISGNTDLKVHEPVILARAVSQLRSAISETITPSTFLYLLQGEVAVAHYFMRDGRWNEARYHANVAARLAVDFGLGELGRIRDSCRCDDETRRQRGFSAFRLFPGECFPRMVEHLDLDTATKAFYNVVLLEKCLAAILDTESVIDTESVDSVFLASGHGLIQTCSALFLKANAAVLLHRATLISKQNNTSIGTIRALDGTITSFLQNVEDSRLLVSPIIDDREYLTLTTLLVMARIELKLPFESTYAVAHKEIIDTLVAFVRTMAALNILTIRPFNSAMGNIWVAMCSLMHVELQHAQAPSCSSCSPDTATMLAETSSEFVRTLLPLGEMLSLRSMPFFEMYQHSF